MNSPIATGAVGIRTGLGADAIAQALVDNLHCLQAKPPQHATRNDWYMALAYTVRDRMLDRYITTLEAIARRAQRREGRRVSLGRIPDRAASRQQPDQPRDLGGDAAGAVQRSGRTWRHLLEQEEEPGLGNGGLGRLAACYMDSLATLNVPAIGYGIRYEFGIFDQAIRDGWQVELTDKWLRFGNPWEIVRSEVTFDVKFGGRTEHYQRRTGPVPRALGSRASGQGRRLRHAGARLSARPRRTCCACGRRKRPSRSTSRRSTSATTTARWTRRSRRRPSRRCSIRTTSRKRESSCGWRSSTSSSPARCRT